MPRSSPRSRSTFRASALRRAIAFGVAGACAAAFALTALTPAAAATTQTATCVDGSGVRWLAKAIWGNTYSSGGVRKVRIGYAGWTTNRAGAVRTDSRVRSYDGTGKRLRTLTWTGAFNYASGTAYKSRNPLNPTSAPGAAKITVTLGVDGDGLGNCTMTFTQPGATAPRPGSSPSPTSKPTSPRLQTRLADLETRLADIETRLADIETHLADIETHLADIQTRLADIDTRFDCGTKGLHGLPGCRLHRRSGWPDIDDRDR